MNIALTHASRGNVTRTCATLGVSKATFYRRRAEASAKAGCIAIAPPRRRSARRIPSIERSHIFKVLCLPRFADLAPRQVYATLLQEGGYLCSVRSMYRILQENKAVCERRRQRKHPKNAKPILKATGINQLWSWDITKIPGPVRGVWYSLYVVMDVFSRYVVAWHIDAVESAKVAEKVIKHAAKVHGVQPDELTLHADRGSPMTSRTVRIMLEDLGITKSHSRPRVSDDNPYSEAQFKTLKYHRDFPSHFNTLEDARAFLKGLLHWYNHEHHHEGIAYFTPAQVYSGEHHAIMVVNQAALNAAYAKNPERFVAGRPIAKMPPEVVGINLPKTTFPVSPAGKIKPDTMPSQSPNLARAR